MARVTFEFNLVNFSIENNESVELNDMKRIIFEWLKNEVIRKGESYGCAPISIEFNNIDGMH